MRIYGKTPLPAIHGLRGIMPSLETPLPAIHGLRGIMPSLAKKIPAEAGKVRGKSMTTPEVFSATSTS
jgi:hypothetical protein